MSADEHRSGRKPPRPDVPTGISSDVRYPLDLVSPLTTLEQEFTHSPNILAKVAELRKRGYTHRRRVRGDGNCFYRAVGVAWLEALAARAQRREFLTSTPALTWPDVTHFGDLAQEYQRLQRIVEALLRSSTEAEARDISGKLFVCLLGDLRFDLCMVLLMRRSVADFLDNSSQDSDIRQTVIAQHGSMENFVNHEVLPLGQEAEGASLVAAAQHFGLRMTIMQLDSTPGPIVEYTYPSEEYSGPLGIHIGLLFKPGHYEVLYHEDMPMFPEPLSFTGRCSFCRRHGTLLSSGLLVCFHRMCDLCQERPANASRHAASESLWCLACSGPTVPSHRRPCSAPAVRKPAAAFIHDTLDSGASRGSGTSIDENIQCQGQAGVRATTQLHQPPSWRRSWTPPPPPTKAVIGHVRRLPPTADSSTQRALSATRALSVTKAAAGAPPKLPGATSGRSPSPAATLGRVPQGSEAQPEALCFECGEFYGSPATNGMCSQCFRQAPRQKDDGQIANKRPPPTMRRRTSSSKADCLECTCGYSCGTRLAFEKHLHRFLHSADHLLVASSPVRRTEDSGEQEELIDTRVQHFASQRSAWSGRPSTTIEADVSFALKGSSCLGCTCGFTCGTTKALQKHLTKYPESAAHQPGMLEDIRQPTWEDPPVLDEVNTLREEILRASSTPDHIQLIV